MYKTSDLGLAAALIVIGNEIVKLDKTEIKKVYFVFKDSTVLQEEVKDYWNSILLVEPNRYFNTMKMLKNRIYGD